MNEYAFFQEMDLELPEIPPDSIVSRTIYQDEKIKVILFGFAPGQELSEHTSTMIALLHFLRGEASLTLGQDQKEAQAGTWVRIAPNLSHSIQAHSALTLLLVLIEP